MRGAFRRSSSTRPPSAPLTITVLGRTGALAFLPTPGRTAVSLLGAYAHTAIGRRRSLGSVLRVGDQ
ncbi:hypothetical protein [Nonomuraea recticatena]|uniref:Uncharacterized protein n=1 Tax=Nonomuraea recticatena TaxID=46178 RepID=A0ABN3RCY6_9ACTN